jgi:hypothetical protein
LIIGISHLCLGQFLRNTKDGKHVSILVLLIGSLEMLGALFSFTFAKGILGQVFEMIYPGIILASMMLSVYRKTRSLLVISALFTIAYLVRISVVYFADSLGWPLILVIIGLVFIGLGYLVYNLNNRFLTTSKNI